MSGYPDARLLAQPTRRRIVEHLRLLPGDHFRSIVRSLHLSLSTTRHHLSALTKNGHVRSEKIGGKLRYFVVTNGSAPPLNETFRLYWKYQDLRVRVWMAVLRTSEARPSTVAASLGISRQLASYHLRCLTELGLLVRSHGRYLAANPKGWEAALSWDSNPRRDSGRADRSRGLLTAVETVESRNESGFSAERPPSPGRG